MKLKVLDLFSGIGGFSLGLERTGGFETVAFCEIEEFPQKVLRRHWPDVPIYEDIKEFDGVAADVITGGYPCQPFSTAGKRGGAEDDRHLWPEMYRLIKNIRPRWVVAENVAGHISMGLDAVLSDLEAEDYAWWAFVIPACARDAKHRRDRVWIVGNSGRTRGRGGESGHNGFQVGEHLLAAPGREQGSDTIEGSGLCGGRLWGSEPSVGRVAHGIPGRVDRLKSLGNAIVPQIAEMIGYAILEAEA